MTDSKSTALALAQANKKAFEVAALMREFKGKTDALRFECEGLKQLLHHQHENHQQLTMAMHSPSGLPQARISDAATGFPSTDRDTSAAASLGGSRFNGQDAVLHGEPSSVSIEHWHAPRPKLLRAPQLASAPTLSSTPSTYDEKLMNELSSKSAEVNALRANEVNVLAALAEAEQKFALLLEREEEERQARKKLYDNSVAEQERLRCLEEVRFIRSPPHPSQYSFVIVNVACGGYAQFCYESSMSLCCLLLIY